MFVRKVDAKTTPISEIYDDWERIWMGEKEIRRFLAYTGLSAPPYNLRVEHFLKFPFLRGISAGKFMRKLQKLGVTWSFNRDVVRRGVLQAVGYKWRDIEEFEHMRVFGRKEVSAHAGI
jgi:hypothetical protein